jgi:hypothetical protein
VSYLQSEPAEEKSRARIRGNTGYKRGDARKGSSCHVPPSGREVELRPGRDVIPGPVVVVPRPKEEDVKGADTGTREEEVSVSGRAELLDVPVNVAPLEVVNEGLCEVVGELLLLGS